MLGRQVIKKRKLAKGPLTVSFKSSGPQKFRLMVVVRAAGHVSGEGPQIRQITHCTDLHP